MARSAELASVGSLPSKVAYAEVESADEPEADEHKHSDAWMRRYCRKIDCRILAYLMVLNVLNQSDRGSIGVAKVVGLEGDLGMVKNDFNVAATLFTVGYLSMEPFSNFVLKRVGASKLLPTLGVLWGAVCMAQGAISTKAQLFAIRVLLGVAECGFTAGTLLILGFFYPKRKLTARVGFFYLSSPLANVVSGPLASGLSQIHHHTIRRWQWVFLLEGAITVVVALLGYYVLQDHPERCRFLSADEKDFIASYKRQEGTLGGSQHITLGDVRRVLGDWQLWVLLFATFATCEAGNSVTVFAPELINELGFSSTQSQALSALPSICGCVAILLSGRIVRACGSHWLAGCLVLATSLVGSVIMAATVNIPARMFGLCLLGTGGFAGLGILPGWNITAYSRTVADSAVASAMTVFYGALSNTVSSNVFLNSDAPRFAIGHSVNIAILAAGILACVAVRASMCRRNRQLDHAGDANGFRFAL